MTKDDGPENHAEAPQTPPSPAEEARPANSAPTLSAESPKRRCSWCGRDVNESAYVCPYCGKNPWGPWGRDGRDEQLYRRYQTQEPLSSEASGGLTLGAIMALLAGVLALGQGLLYMVVGQAVGDYAPSGFICFCGGIDALFGLLSIGAGVFALQRKNFMLAVGGAVCGMLGLGILIGFVFGLIALILIALSREEFES